MMMSDTALTIMTGTLYLTARGAMAAPAPLLYGPITALTFSSLTRRSNSVTATSAVPVESAVTSSMLSLLVS